MSLNLLRAYGCRPRHLRAIWGANEAVHRRAPVVRLLEWGVTPDELAAFLRAGANPAALVRDSDLIDGWQRTLAWGTWRAYYRLADLWERLTYRGTWCAIGFSRADGKFIRQSWADYGTTLREAVADVRGRDNRVVILPEADALLVLKEFGWGE